VGRENAAFWAGNPKSRICLTTTKKTARPATVAGGINCRWEFFASRSPSAPVSGAAIIYLFFIPARLALFSPSGPDTLVRIIQYGETSPAVDGQWSGYIRRQGV
jgi:hypothetical protein